MHEPHQHDIPATDSGAPSDATGWPLLLSLALFALAYAGCALVGHLLMRDPGAFVAFWLPSGLFVGVLLRQATRRWPWFILAALAANLAFDVWNGKTAGISLLFFTGNALEAVVGAWLARRYVAARPRLSTLRETLSIIGICAVASPALSATVGTFVVTRVIGQGSWASMWPLWWSGDMLGVLLFAPVVLAWPSRQQMLAWSATPGRLAERMLFFALCAGVGLLVFPHAWHADVSLRYLAFLLVLFAATRYGIAMTVMTSLLLAVIASWYFGHGTIEEPTTADSIILHLVLDQVYLAVTAMAGLLLAVILRERERTYLLMHQYQQQLHAIVEGTTDAIYLKDLQGRYLLVNDAVCRYVGRAADAIIGRDDTALFPPEEARVIMEADHQIMVDAVVTSFDEHVTTTDGVARTFHSTKGPLYDAHARVIGLFGVARDVTAWIESERTLQASEAKFATFMEFLPGFAYIKDDRHQHLFMNHALERFLDCTREHWHGQTLATLLPEAAATEIAVHDNAVLQSRAPMQVEETILVDGHPRTFLSTKFPINQPDGTLGIGGISLDITERKVAAEALQESETRFRAIFEHSIDAIGVSNTGIHHYVNSAYLTLFGYEDSAELLGQSILALIAPDHRERIADYIQRRANGDPLPNVYETRGQRKDGTVFEMDVHVSTYDMHGETYTIAHLRDITARKQADEHLQTLSQRLQLASHSGKLGIWDWDIIANQMTWDDRMVELYGYTWATFPGGIEAWQQGLYHADSARAWEDCQAALRGERDFDTEFRVQHPDGAILHLKADGLVIRDADGQAIRMLGINYDITARKQAEEQLLILKYSIDTAPDGAYWMDMDGRFIYVNDAACEALGYDRAELLTMCLSDVNPTVTPERWATVTRMLREQRYYVARSQHRRKNGTLFPVEITSTYFRFGNQEYCNGFARDITERVRMEEALHLERDRNELYLNVAEVILVALDDHGRVTMLNRKGYEVLGHEPGALTGQNWFASILPVGEAATVNAVFQSILAGEIEPFEYYENHVVTRTGDTRLIAWRNSFVRDEDGHIIGSLSSGEDITERRKAEEALRASESLFRSLFDEHVAVKLLIDPLNGQIVDANHAAAAFYGWTRETLQSMRIQDINTLNPDEVAREMERARNLQRVYFEFRHRQASGDARDVAVFSSSIWHEGRQLLHSIVHDITAGKRAESDRERLQDQLLQSQKMESIGRLAGGVAHDFNNMLGAILGYTELVMMQSDADDPIQADLQEIKRAAERSADLTRQLLAFARKQTVAPKVLDLNDAVAGMLKMLQRLIGEDIQLVWQPGAELGAIYMDPAQLDQILANLCVNARDAIRGVGTLTIETHHAIVDEQYCANLAEASPGDYLVLTVSDNGVGMTADIIAHLFEPFYTTKEVGEGTGLGLATVYGIVKQNSGFVNVYSEPGLGSTFAIYLPRHGASISPLAAESTSSDHLTGTETVLLVEDETAILELGTRVLTRHGYTVLAAGTPDAALRLASAHPERLHLVVTDVVMPEMNGRDLVHLLHAQHPELRTLFMSGYTANVIAHHGVLDAGVHFLQKPFTTRDLLAKVRDVLDQPRVE